MTHPVAMSIPSTQMLFPKYHPPEKGFWSNVCRSEAGTWHCSLQKVKCLDVCIMASFVLMYCLRALSPEVCILMGLLVRNQASMRVKISILRNVILQGCALKTFCVCLCVCVRYLECLGILEIMSQGKTRPTVGSMDKALPPTMTGGWSDGHWPERMYCFGNGL